MRISGRNPAHLAITLSQLHGRHHGGAPMDKHGVLVVVLWLIAAYHILLGVGALLSEQTAEQLAANVFGLRLQLTPQSSYLVKLLGIYATVFGLVVGLAARAPENHPGILYVVIVLYLLRILNKVAFKKVQVEEFQAK